MNPRRSFVFLLLLFPFLNFLGGCAGTHSSVANNDSQQLYTVTATSTAFYTHGPRQGAPDQQLPKDTPLRLIRYSPSFAKVALVEGPTGFVLTDDIAPSRQPVFVGAGPRPAPALAGSPQTPANVTDVPSRVPEAPLPEFEPPPLPAPSN